MKLLRHVLLCHLYVLECFAMSPSEIEDFSNYLKKTSNLDQKVKSKQPKGGYDEDSKADSDYAWERSGKFEGDIILNEPQRKMIVSNIAGGLARNGLTDTTKRWPNNELIYIINTDHFYSSQVQSIQNGINALASLSCVKFRPYQQGDRDAVVIQGDNDGCYSQIGYEGGFQVLNLDNRHYAGYGCFTPGVVMHELLHALGFFHMQSSSDRDDYVYVLWDNIQQLERHNFRKYNSYTVTDFGLGYDYSSVLHYGPKAFSWNGQDTIVAKFSGQTITDDVYCQQLQTMMEKLAAKQPRLVNRSTALLLHDNARPHTAQQTATKLEELQLECLSLPSRPCFQQIIFFFGMWITSCKGKKSTPMRDFIDSLPPVFF